MRKNWSVFSPRLSWTVVVVVFALAITGQSRFSFGPNPSGNATNAINFTRRISQLLSKQLEDKTDDYSYNKALPPQYPVYTTVRVSIWPWSLQRVDQVNGIIQVHTQITLSWRDDRLQVPMDSKIAANKEANKFFTEARILVDPTQIWMPALYIAEDMHGGASSLLNNIDVTVQPNTGEVELAGYFLDARSCQMNAREFPFDQQRCLLSLTARGKVRLKHRSLFSLDEVWQDVVDEPSLYESGEWSMFSSKTQLNRTINTPVKYNYSTSWNESYLSYEFFFTRKSSSHLLNWILPPLLLSAAGTISMYCGCTVEDRYGFGSTMTVTLAVMQASLREALSVSWDGYPILGQLYLGLLFGMILATMLSSLPSWIVSRSTRMSQIRRRKIRLVATVFPSFMMKEPEELCDRKIIRHKNFDDDGKVRVSLKKVDLIVMAGCLAFDAVVVLYCLVRWMPAFLRVD